MPPTKRRGRGVDFEHRFSASRWAEDKVFEAINAQPGLICVRLGLSGFSSDNSVSTTVGEPKVPDLLILDESSVPQPLVSDLQSRAFDLTACDSAELERGGPLAGLWAAALTAIEVEFSPYRAAEMKGRHWKARSEEAFQRRPLKHANPPVAPNIFVKHEDLDPLLAWQAQTGVPVLVLHVFDQEAFAIELDNVQQFREFLGRPNVNRVMAAHITGIFPKEQRYDRSDAQGAAERKLVYMVSPAASRCIGEVTRVTVKAQLAVSSSKKYVSQVIFGDGQLNLTDDTLNWIRTLKQ